MKTKNKMGQSFPSYLAIGLDVGSTTVKAVVIDPINNHMLWCNYQRHHTKQPEKVLELIEAIFSFFPKQPKDQFRIFLTGSGSAPLAEVLGGKFVQEVNAVTFAVEHLHPDVSSVVELGGQDAKIVLFKQDRSSGDRTAHASMNDKCASGTGATIDKCFLKVNAPSELVTTLRFDSSKLHHVAAKCGVFAETDIVNLIKSGIPSEEVLCSLADAIVTQNLSVLTRGHTLKPKVLLLGGPNTYLPFLQDCWRLRIPQIWDERGFIYPKDVPIEELIIVPEKSEYYAAMGAVLYGLHEPIDIAWLKPLSFLSEYISVGRKARLGESAGPSLIRDEQELLKFKEAYRVPLFEPKKIESGQKLRAVIGLDGGSTSSKAVLVDYTNGDLLAKAYQLSKGNPIQDTKELLTQLSTYVTSQSASLEIMGFGATGYAADILEKCIKSDVNVVETVAHMVSAVHFFGEVDVICDVGGQDIKVLFLKNGDIQNFRLSNSCSAGNGMLLQATADSFGVHVSEFADVAFQAELAPKFSYGCAVFLDTDRVNFQKEGFTKEEMLAGLAQVLPKNVWQYVVQIPRMAALGKKFVLQGGTQYNLAAVKAQVDYIKQRVDGAEVYVHPHTGEAGAIGAAMEALRVVKRRGYSTFVGMESAMRLEYRSKTDAETVCHFCPNECKRTFIDTKTPDGQESRYIAGFSCEKGTVESREQMLTLTLERKKIATQFPNMLHYEAKKAFAHFYKPKSLPEADSPLSDVEVRKGFFGIRRVKVTRAFRRSNHTAMEHRARMRIGIPRVLNMYSVAPWFRTYFETLGVLKQNVVFSDETTEENWQEGGKYGSIDPCFPSKVAQAHIHNLLFHHHSEKKRLHYIFFPILTHVDSFVADTVDNATCPIVAGAPEVLKAAFTKEVDFFAQRGIGYLDPALSFEEPLYMKRRLFECFGDKLQITEDENDHACDEAWNALRQYDADVQKKGRAILDTVESENRIAILIIGRPYHADPGLNHGIPEEFQVLGYPILSIRSIPKSRDYLDRFFEKELKAGIMKTPLELNHIWPENYSANSAQKVWAANFAAHHPHVVVLDLSSFKCGHDAPTFGLIDNIIESSKTPYAALHDIDANKPGGSIKIRVKTYEYALKRHIERLQDAREKHAELGHVVNKKRLEFFEMVQNKLQSSNGMDPELERKIGELKMQVRAYEIKKGEALEHVDVSLEQPLKNIVKVKRKMKDGSLSEIDLSQFSARDTPVITPSDLLKMTINAAE